MSDDTKKDTDVTEPKVDTSGQQDAAAELLLKAEAEKKEIIAQRDKAKAKLREVEEKERKAKEAKDIEDGKLKEVIATKDAELAKLRSKVEVAEAVETARRQKALDRVTDPELKAIAEKLTDSDDINAFIEKLGERKKLATHTAKGGAQNALELPKFKDFKEYEKFVNEQAGEAGGIL